MGDKWVLLVHGDSDGVVSGALAYAFYTSRGYDVEVYFTHPVDLVKDLEEFAEPGDSVFIADIALNEKHLEEIKEVFKQYAGRGRIIYIDHHPEPLGLSVRELDGEIIHDTCCSASELAYRYFHKLGLSNEYERIALYGAIGDYIDYTPWVRKSLLDWDKRSIYFEAGLLVQGLEGSRKDYDFKRRIVKLLARNSLPSMDPVLVVRALNQSILDEDLRVRVRSSVVKRGEVCIVRDPGGSLGRAANYARIYGGCIIGLAFEDRRGKCVASLRSDTVDLNRLLRYISRKMQCSGGGHPFAAGARLLCRDIGLFIELINMYYKNFIH